MTRKRYIKVVPTQQVITCYSLKGLSFSLNILTEELKVSSYNCRGLPKDPKTLLLRPDLLEVFDKSHVVAIQETWYAKQNLQNLNCLHNFFY